MFIFNCRWVAGEITLQVFESVGLRRSSCGRVSCKRGAQEGKRRRREESTSRRSGGRRKVRGEGDPVRLILG